jgi:hypothetical protein
MRKMPKRRRNPLPKQMLQHNESKWDVNAPTSITIREVPTAVEEGSWMDVDVSPDGRTVAFALLGDIYTMPIAGGSPTRIS